MDVRMVVEGMMMVGWWSKGMMAGWQWWEMWESVDGDGKYVSPWMVMEICDSWWMVKESVIVDDVGRLDSW